MVSSSHRVAVSLLAFVVVVFDVSIDPKLYAIVDVVEKDVVYVSLPSAVHIVVCCIHEDVLDRDDADSTRTKCCTSCNAPITQHDTT